MAAVSEEEIVQIANNFLLNAPPGEFLEVATDVRSLLANDSVLDSTALDTFREYNTEQMLQVKSPGHDHELLVCKFAEIAEGEFVDHRGKQGVTGQRPLQGGDFEADMESLRAAVDDALAPYALEHYPYGAACAFSRKEDNGSKQIIVAISAARFQGSNYQYNFVFYSNVDTWASNGRWRSTWVASLSGRELKLAGTLKLHVHYYEDGNVQLNTDSQRNISVPDKGVCFLEVQPLTCQNPRDTAAALIAAIAKAEGEFQSALELSYNTMSENTFKVSILTCKVNWEKIHQYRLGNDIGGVTPSYRRNLSIQGAKS